MFFRIRVALGIALLLSLVASIRVSAKGGYAFITVSGPGLQEEVRTTDAALTTNFFAFADFYRDKTTAPANPGVGYEITRNYIDGNREYVFDRLHYYPETGFVYYDGIENGESEYDGEWYIAKTEIKVVFQSALSIQTRPVAPAEKKQPISSQAENSIPPSQPVRSGLQSLPGLSIAVAIGLAALLAFALWRRKSSTQ
jgi:hypothetical protein